MTISAVPKLFQPTKVGTMNLAHRVVLAPLTRFRADENHVLGELSVDYYAQRASYPGTFLISEATMIAPKAGKYVHVPHIVNEEQVNAWKRITDAVHNKGSRIFCQLWALGRVSDPHILGAYFEHDPSFEHIGPSAIPVPDSPNTPRPLTLLEIKEYVQLYTSAALNAMRAGFDGVEIHGAHGYLIDQFIQDTSNQRTDEYGGSIENRCRFALEIIDSVVKAIGASKVGLRVSPWNGTQGMRMQDPVPTFSYLISQIVNLYPDFVYIHAVEPRVNTYIDREVPAGESNDFLRKIWAPRPFISAGGFRQDNAFEAAERTGDLIAFGRAFISNPDLPLRISKGLKWTEGNRATYYAPLGGSEGYTDYPFADESTAQILNLL